MLLSDEDVAVLRADLERAQREKEAALGTSFDGQGGGSSADRRETAASTMGPM